MNKRRTFFLSSLLLLTIISIDYGWRLFGFDACTTTFPSVTEVSVRDDVVSIKGTTHYSGDHYIGNITKIEDNTLYVGMRYQLFTVFHKGGSFNIRIALENEAIEEIYIKGRSTSELIWEKN